MIAPAQIEQIEVIGQQLNENQADLIEQLREGASRDSAQASRLDSTVAAIGAIMARGLKD